MASPATGTARPKHLRFITLPGAAFAELYIVYSVLRNVLSNPIYLGQIFANRVHRHPAERRRSAGCRSVYRRRASAAAGAPARPTRRGPVGACSDAELVEHIRAEIVGSRLHGEGYRKIWARLRHAGIRTSARRVRRLMGQHGLLAPLRVGRPERRVHGGTITTTAVDVMWGTDMTETATLREGRARVFVAVDHCSGECVGSHAARSGNRFEALEPMRQGVLRHFGAIERDSAKGLALRHDHSSNSMSGDFQDEIAFFDLESSPSFVRQPEGNGVAERFIRTLASFAP